MGMRFLLLMALCLPLPAFAQSIVATVNDEAITSADLDGRLRLALLGSGMKPDAATLERLREQVLRALVDERLQLQEAVRLNIDVSDKEVLEQKARLAQQNNLAANKLPAFFASAGVPMAALEAQIRASIAWGKVVQRSLRGQVNVNESDIDGEIARLEATRGKPEYLLAEIFLPVDSPKQEERVRQAANRLLDQISKGARFSVIARQFSQSASAAQGGDIGWVQRGQLAPEQDKVLATMRPGTVAPPIRTANGYSILMLRQQRVGQGAAEVPEAPPPAPVAVKGSYNLVQVLVPLRPEAKPEAVRAANEKVQSQRAKTSSCAEASAFAKANGDPGAGKIGVTPANKLPPPVLAVLSSLKDGEPSPVLRNERGVLFLVVCSRKGVEPSAVPAPTVTSGKIDREKIAMRLAGQKMELLARRYLRDLRQSAFIDIRN